MTPQTSEESQRSDLAAGKRLIFALTTGRSGTGYLASVFRELPGVRAEHEPEPKFSDVLRDIQSDPEVARTFWLERKLPAIRRVAESIYIETSHCFSKGFLDPLLELGVVPDAIVLRRSHRAVASSLARLETVPGRTPRGVRFLVAPTDPGVLELPDWEELDDYQLCYWYCLEIERRTREAVHRIESRGGRVAGVEFDALIRGPGWSKLVAELGLPALRGLARWRAALRRLRPVNRKRADKERAAIFLPEDLAERERVVEERVGRSEPVETQ